MKSYSILAVLIAFISTAYGQSSSAIRTSSACGTTHTNGAIINFIADLRNSCWYWECIRRGRRFRLISRPCPVGTAVSSFFGVGAALPCSERFDVDRVKYDCTRKEFNLDQEPPCVADYQRDGTCKNGGQIRFEYSNCFCECPTGFGDWDCSRDLSGPTPPAPAPPTGPNPDDPCPNGIPRTNWCAVADNGRNPCQNNGRCINQCLSYVCQCVPPFTAGRRCETFDCSDNVECLNGGSCSRGENDADQYATCQCRPGFTGLMCEQSINTSDDN